MTRVRGVAPVTLLVATVIAMSGCTVPQRVREAAAQLSDDRLIPAPEAQAFFTAARRGDVVGLRTGLANGLDVNLAEPLYGRTTLMRAVAFDHVAAVQALVDAGADVRVKDFEGDTALHVAAASERRWSKPVEEDTKKWRPGSWQPART